VIPAPAAPVAAIGAATPSAPAAAASRSGPSFGAVLEAKTAAARPPAPPHGPALAALEGVEQAQRRLDAVLAAARRGRTFTAQELLSLQTDAYRFAQTVDLAAKIVEHGAQAVKQAVNTQT
jgi:hypothetical protein